MHLQPLKTSTARAFHLRYSPQAVPSYSPLRKAEPPDERVVQRRHGGNRLIATPVLAIQRSWACDDAEPDIVVLIRWVVVVAIRRTQVVLIIVERPAANHTAQHPRRIYPVRPPAALKTARRSP